MPLGPLNFASSKAKLGRWAKQSHKCSVADRASLPHPRRCRPCSGEPSARKPPSRPSARTCTHPHQRPPHHPPTWTGTTRRAPPASRSTTTPPSLALTPRSPPASSTNASAAASSFSPSPPPYPSAEDFKDSGFQTCYLLDFIGPKKFAFELARFVPSVKAFDHRQSTLARIPKLGQCPNNVELHIDISIGSARSVFGYFSKKLAGTKSDSRMCENLLEQEHVERVSNVLEYIEDADLRRDERAKLNCVTNPHVFEQLLQLDVGDLLTREKSRVRGLLQAAGEFIQKPFRIQLGRGSYGECLAIRADGHTQLSHEIGLELSQRSAAAGLRPIGAVVFMQRGVLKVCLRTSDSTVNTSEIAKAYGGGGKQSSSSFTLRMDEFNIWTSVNS